MRDRPEAILRLGRVVTPRSAPARRTRGPPDRDRLIERACAMLAPVARTLAANPYVFGEAPTIADAALYGQLVMLCYALGEWPPWLPPEVTRFAERMRSQVEGARAA